MKDYTIEYRQRYDDNWIYLAMKLGDKSRIYIYRDRKDRVGEEGWNEWELATDKAVDFDKWYRFEEKWDRDTTCTEVNDTYLQEHNIPPLKIDEKGNIL